MRCKTAVVLSAIIPLSLILHCMLNPIGGTDTGNPNIAGVLYNKDGSRAKNAKVRVIPSDYNPRNGSSILMQFDTRIPSRSFKTPKYASRRIRLRPRAPFREWSGCSRATIEGRFSLS
jgi:hypothetical protein